ncbi:MAG: Myo-inosose-2 dehydratase [Pseudomonadota bacterium]|jgi:sugar phosphate isomerase/epimerase
MTTRRNFLAGAAAFAAASGAPAWANQKIQLGIQLYTVRDDLAKDFEGTLKKVHDIGLRVVQSNLVMAGRPAPELRKIYDGFGFVWDSIHASGAALRDTPQATIDQTRAVGIKDVTCSSPLYPTDPKIMAAGPSLDDWKRNADVFNKIGALCKAAGMTFGFHNHSREFKTIAGVAAFDTLLAYTDPALVNFEMDVGWVQASGTDPVAYLTKYPKRFTALHIKDLTGEGIPNTNNKMNSAIIGTGLVNWTSVLAAARKAAVSRAYLEIEEPYNPSPLGMVEASFNYLKGKI